MTWLRAVPQKRQGIAPADGRAVGFVVMRELGAFVGTEAQDSGSGARLVPTSSYFEKATSGVANALFVVLRLRNGAANGIQSGSR